MRRDAKRSTKHGRDLFRLDHAGDARGAGGAGEAGHPSRRAARARPSRSRTRWSISSPPTTRCSWSSRTATPSCSTLIVNEGAIDPAQADPGAALRRHADHRALHHRDIAERMQHSTRAAAKEGRRMTYIAKPKLHHPPCRPTSSASPGATTRARSRPCAPAAATTSISAAIIQACYELDIQPHRVAKLSGIGCSSKTPDYFLGNSHGFNTRARPHALGADRRQPRQPRADLSRRLGRRRLAPRSAWASSPTACAAA